MSEEKDSAQPESLITEKLKELSDNIVQDTTDSEHVTMSDQPFSKF